MRSCNSVPWPKVCKLIRVWVLNKKEKVKEVVGEKKHQYSSLLDENQFKETLNVSFWNGARDA